jgi:hypothetical protein
MEIMKKIEGKIEKNKLKIINNLGLRRLNNKIIFVICLITILISSIFFQIYFSDEYNSKLNDESNTIIGDVKGDIEFIGKGVYEFNEFDSLRGINWYVNITNLEKIVIGEGRTNERVINTKNLTIIPIEGSYNPYIAFYSLKRTKISGELEYERIESFSDYYDISLEFHTIFSIINANLYDLDEVWINDVNIETDKGILQSITEYREEITLYSEKVIYFKLISSKGSKFSFSISPYFEDSPNLLFLNGTLVVNDFDGRIPEEYGFYISKTVTIESSNISISTLERPYHGDLHGFGWAHDPQYWKIKIIFKGTDLNIEGFKITYWGMGIIFAFIINLYILLGFHYYKDFLNIVKTKGKKYYSYIGGVLLVYMSLSLFIFYIIVLIIWIYESPHYLQICGSCFTILFPSTIMGLYAGISSIKRSSYSFSLILGIVSLIPMFLSIALFGLYFFIIIPMILLYISGLTLIILSKNEFKTLRFL